jgi:vacuolar-type H+-ATPase subunit F/Vma7
MFYPVFIGDKLSAAGFRLAGAEVHIPEPGTELPIFQEALERADLIIITADIAVLLPESLLEKNQINGAPLLMIIDDICGMHQSVDIAVYLRQQLGMAEGNS